MASIELEPTNTGILKMKDCLSLRDFDRIIPLSLPFQEVSLIYRSAHLKICSNNLDAIFLI